MVRIKKPYFSLIEPKKALKELLSKVVFPEPRPIEQISVQEAIGRVTSKVLKAKFPSPISDVAAMDGFAVRYKDTLKASNIRPVVLKIEKDCRPISTGDLLPKGFDSVVKIEDVDEFKPGYIQIQRPAVKGEHVRRQGEDIEKDMPILPRNKLITPFDLGAILAGGYSKVSVIKRPEIAIIPTGEELIAPSRVPRPGEVIEFNSYIIEGLIKDWGGKGIRFKPVSDDLKAIGSILEDALARFDAVVIIGGSSLGVKDLVPEVILKQGILIAHGVKVMPGRPTTLGIINKKPIFGLPGYPISCAVACEYFILPFITNWLKVSLPQRDRIEAVLLAKISKEPGLERVVYLNLGFIEGRYVAFPIRFGASKIRALARADGLTKIPPFIEGIEDQVEIQVELLVQRQSIKDRVIIGGRYISILDQLSSKIVLFEMGDIKAVMAVRNKEVHIGIISIQEKDKGLSFIRAYFREVKPLVIIKQGGEIYLFFTHPIFFNQGVVKDFWELFRSLGLDIEVL
jgi:putative molybdopterin biosynthesis protein